MMSTLQMMSANSELKRYVKEEYLDCNEKISNIVNIEADIKVKSENSKEWDQNSYNQNGYDYCGMKMEVYEETVHDDDFRSLLNDANESSADCNIMMDKLIDPCEPFLSYDRNYCGAYVPGSVNRDEYFVDRYSGNWETPTQVSDNKYVSLSFSEGETASLVTSDDEIVVSSDQDDHSLGLRRQLYSYSRVISDDEHGITKEKHHTITGNKCKRNEICLSVSKNYHEYTEKPSVNSIKKCKRSGRNKNQHSRKKTKETNKLKCKKSKKLLSSVISPSLASLEQSQNINVPHTDVKRVKSGSQRSATDISFIDCNNLRLSLGDDRVYRNLLERKRRSLVRKLVEELAMLLVSCNVKIDNHKFSMRSIIQETIEVVQKYFAINELKTKREELESRYISLCGFPFTQVMLKTEFFLGSDEL